VFLVEIVSFLIIWPIVWWLGGLLAEDGIETSPKPPLPDNVIDLEQFRRRHPTGRRNRRSS
jgi:hypothetical protein